MMQAHVIGMRVWEGCAPSKINTGITIKHLHVTHRAGQWQGAAVTQWHIVAHARAHICHPQKVCT